MIINFHKIDNLIYALWVLENTIMALEKEILVVSCLSEKIKAKKGSGNKDIKREGL